MSDEDLKVTDKRMFTADGELREEYRHLEKGASSEPASQPGPEPAPKARPETASEPRSEAAPEPPPRSPAAPDAAPHARVEIPDSGAAQPVAGFFDLVSLLAEPVALYLGDVQLPDGRTAEDLQMARLHIDLLDLLRQKTVGNLSLQEAAFLDDLLYKLRLRYVQKRG